jgi:hypothetical protein
MRDVSMKKLDTKSQRRIDEPIDDGSALLGQYYELVQGSRNKGQAVTARRAAFDAAGAGSVCPELSERHKGCIGW